MLYISLILITLGILFILYTLVTSTRKQSVSNNSLADADKDVSAAMNKPVNEHVNIETDNIMSGNNEKYETEEHPGVRMEDLSFEGKKETAPVKADMIEDENIIGEQNSNRLSGEDVSKITDVSLYEDSSNIIDYDNNDSIIDSGLSEYKKIKRIGEGTIELLNDGINFRTGKKLFRFDYHRVSDVKKGKNYFVLLMKGSNTSRIFVFKNTALLNSKFNQFHQADTGNIK